MKAEVIIEEYGDHTIRQQVIINNTTYEIFGNVRKEAGDFNAAYHCDICDKDRNKFNPKLIQLPKGTLACSRCVNDFMEVINTATLSDCRKGREDNV